MKKSKKEKTSAQKVYMHSGSRAFDLLLGAVSCLELEFSTKYNATWKINDAVRMFA